MLSLLGCSPPPLPHVVLDLPQAFAGAEIRREISSLDIGTPQAREHLLEGWSRNERSPSGATFVWSLGEASWVRFYLARPRPLRLELRGAPYEGPGDEAGTGKSGLQRVSVEMNGHAVGELPLASGMGTYALELPADALVAGDNLLTLRYARVASPHATASAHEARRLGVAWGGLALRPASASAQRPPTASDGVLDLPWDSEVSFYFEHRGGSALLLEGLETESGDQGILQILFRAEGGQETVLREIEGRRRRARVELPEAPGLVRLTLRAIPGDGSKATPGTGGLRLYGGKVRSASPSPPEGSPSTPPPIPLEQRPNVVIYLVDTLRADRLGCYGDTRGLTPHLDAFARDALVFRQAVAPSPWTRPSVATLLTGLHPLAHGVTTLESRLPDAAITLGEALGAAGYRTAAFSTNWHILPATGFAQGFDDFLFLQHDTRSSTLTARAVEWIDRHLDGEGAPFFLYLHALDPHAPYEPPAEERRRFASQVERRGAGSRGDVQEIYGLEGEERARRVADLPPLYDAEVAANDRSFGALLEALEARGLAESTLVVFASDHGEGFDEHGFLGHGNTLYGELLDIPLAMKLPGPATRGEPPSGAAEATARLARLEDVMPTVLARLGLEPPAPLTGRDLLAPLPAGAPEHGALSHLSYEGRDGVRLTLGDWAYIEPWSRAFARSPLLFDHRRDAGEQEDLAPQNPVRAGFLASRLRLMLAAARARSLAAEEAQLDEEMIRGLEALGYL